MALSENITNAIIAGTQHLNPESTQWSSHDAIQAMLTTPLRSSAASTSPDTLDTRLWLAVAAEDLWQRAGYVPPKNRTPSDFHPSPNNEHTCPRAARETLHLILNGIHSEFLHEWLVLAKQHRVSIPPVYLVPLFSMSLPAHTRLALKHVVDQRGLWLLKQNPTWASQFHVLDVEKLLRIWELGSFSDRVNAIRQLRSLDPTLARTKIMQEWDKEGPDQRAELIKVLHVQLGVDDQEFIERALDDKRQEVRVQAQELLLTLPNSLLKQRYFERLNSIVEYKVSEESENGIKQLVFIFPEKISNEMKRDGLGRVQRAGMGEKANLLFELVQALNPQCWCERWNLTPQAVWQVFSESDYGEVLRNALFQAICREVSALDRTNWEPKSPAMQWLEMLLDPALLIRSKFPMQYMNDLVRSLLHLPVSYRESVLLDALQNNYPYAETMFMSWSAHRLREQAEAPNQITSSSLTLSRQALQFFLYKLIEKTEMYNPSWSEWSFIKSQIKEMSHWLSVENLDYIDADWPSEKWPYWSQLHEAHTQFKETLRFRQQLEHSFLEKS